MGKSNGSITLTEDQIKNLVKQAGEAGAAAYEKKNKKSAEEKVHTMLYRTKVLLEKYRYLHDYSEKSVYSLKQMADSQENPDSDVDFEMLAKFGILDEDITLYRMKKGVATVKILMDHVDRMLEIYKTDCETSSSEVKKRQWRVIENLYLADERLTTKQIAEQENQDLRVIQQDAKNAREDLTALIFGLDGILVRILNN